jgi:transposase
LLQLKRRVLSPAADNVIVTCIWFGGKPLWGGVTTNSLVLLQLKWDKPSARISYNFERRCPMPKKTRKRFTAQEKVAILRLHLLEQTPISDLCDQHGIHPTMFYRWQKEFFENGAAALEPRSRRPTDVKDQRIATLEQKLQRKHEVLSELMEEHIKLKKELGEL